MCIDKTQIFHDQIEVKQKELEPWNKKINDKEAEIKIAKGEREALQAKAAQAKASLDRAETDLIHLREDYESKQASLEELQAEKAKVQHEIQEAEREYQVRAASSLKPSVLRLTAVDREGQHAKPARQSHCIAPEGRGGEVFTRAEP